jgi:hypothetical protein
MDSPREVAFPHPRAMSEPARDARARAWAFVFDCYRKKEAAAENRPKDPERSSDDIRAKARIP